jgi:hypothetical protein
MFVLKKLPKFITLKQRNIKGNKSYKKNKFLEQIFICNYNIIIKITIKTKYIKKCNYS